MSSVSKEINDILKTLKGEETDGVCGSSNRAKACYNIQQAIKGNSDFKNITNGSNAKGVNEIAKYVLENGISGGASELEGEAVAKYKDANNVLKIKEVNVVKSDLPEGTKFDSESFVVAYGKTFLKKSTGDTLYRTNPDNSECTFVNVGDAEKSGSNYPVQVNMTINGTEHNKVLNLTEPLRSVFGVCDTVDLRGKVKRRVGVITLTGTESFTLQFDAENYVSFKYTPNKLGKPNMDVNRKYTCLCNRLHSKSSRQDMYSATSAGVAVEYDGSIMFSLPKSWLSESTVDALKTYLSTNNIIIYYPLDSEETSYVTSASLSDINNSNLTNITTIDIELGNSLKGCVEADFTTNDTYAIDFLSKKRGATWNGSLQVVNGEVCNQYGTPFTVRGMSTHCLGLRPQYDNKGSYATFKDYGANVIRLAMYLKDNDTYDYKGYEDSREEVWKMVDERIQACIDLDMYVIADFHGLSADSSVSTHLDKAKEFFNRVATKYKDYPNVLYELFNEPNDSWTNIKSYAETLITYIRAIDSDAFCIVPTPSFDEDWNSAISNPLSASNIAYTQHFYNGYSSTILTNLNSSLPMFVTEFGVGDPNNGELQTTANYTNASMSMDMLSKFNISWCMWALTGRDVCAHSVVKESSTKSQKWTREELSPTGQWVIKQF